MYLVTSEEMRGIDRYAIETIGIPAMVLMENAGRAIAEEVARFDAERPLPRRGRERPPRWLILAGKGNNGGDGIACARHLRDQGYEVGILYAVPPGQLNGEAALQRGIAAKIGLPEEVYGGEGTVAWSRWDGIVDALLGTGTSGPPREPYAALIREANGSGLPIVAADIPSGLDADTGEAADPCIRASVTVALGCLKRGLLLYPGAETAGETVVRRIGIPDAAARRQGVKTFALGPDTLRGELGLAWPPERRPDSHKGTYGHVLVAAGSRDMSGAGLLCAGAALRAGCGLVSWALPDRLVSDLAGRLPEAMLRGVPDGGIGRWDAVPVSAVAELAAGKQAAVVGPGMGRWPGDAEWLRGLWSGIETPLVLDADALNMLADAGSAPGGWQTRPAPAVLTPHPGEMARLCGLSVREVQRDRIGIARRYAETNGVTLVLKGAHTVIALPDGRAFVNVTGNPGMATGGAGDVLAGIVAGLLAQGMDAGQAAAAGVFLHGAAGDRAAAARHSPFSLTAGDIIEAL